MAENPSILLIEESEEDRQRIIKELENEPQYFVATRITREDEFALALEEGGFNLAITSSRLSWTDGLAVLREIKSRYPSCPVIMLGADDDKGMAISAEKAGLDAFLLKTPEHMARLRTTIRFVFRKSRHHPTRKKAEVFDHSLFDGLKVGLFRTTQDGEIVDANPAIVGMLGYPDRETMLTSNMESAFIYLEDLTRLKADMETEGVVRKLEAKLRRCDGKTLWVSVSCRATTDEQSKVVYYEGSMEDITERKGAEEALRVAESNLRSVVSASIDGMVVTDKESVVIFINPAAEEMFGEEASDVLGKPFLCPIEEGDVREIDIHGRKGRKIVARMKVVKVKWEGQLAYLISLHDISDLIEIQEKLRTLTFTDELTGLYNRRGFFILGGQMLKLAERNKRRMILLFSDIDDLKKINDEQGHSEGDLVLKEAAVILIDSFRKSDIVARLGGDEFAVLALETEEDCERVLLDRLEKVRQAYNEGRRRSYTLSLTTGTASYDSRHPSTISELLERGDKSMYALKRNKRHM